MTRKTILSASAAALMTTLLAFSPLSASAADSDMTNNGMGMQNMSNDMQKMKSDMSRSASDIRNDARELKNEASDSIGNMKNKAADSISNMQKEAQSKMSYPANDVSDAAVTERVRHALGSYKNVNVASRNGEVQLDGTVRTNAEKSDIVKRARDVHGVRSVNDSLTVSSSGSESVGGYIDDASITTVVKGKFLGQKGLDSLDISVETTNGVVTLTGEVENAAQIGLAEGVAKEADGVKKVVNHLTYK